MRRIEIDVVVEHPRFGIGRITEISYHTGDPLVSVVWDDGTLECYWTNELEFLVVTPQVFGNLSNKACSSTYGVV